MKEQEYSDLQVSGWWGIATAAFLVTGVAIVVAKLIGPEAVDQLTKVALISIFMVGGVLLGLLTMQALGASQLWGLNENSDASLGNHINEKSSKGLEDFVKAEKVMEREDTDHSIDPFYEILKQNRTDTKAA